MVGLEVKKSGFGGQTPSGLVVTGGGARTVGASEAAKRMLAMPVRIGEPQNIKGIIDEIQDSPFAAVVGLCVYGALLGIESTKSFKFGLSGLPSFGGLSNSKLPKKIIELIKSFIP